MRFINFSAAAVLLTGSLSILTAPPLALSDEPQTHGSEAGTATVDQEPAAPDTAPTIGEEPVSPAETGDIQERGLLSPKLSPGAIQGGTLMPLPRYSAPTPTLNFVANAIQLSFPATNTVDL